MSEDALVCPHCGSPSVRRSRRMNVREMMRMLAGVYPFRCNSCSERFWASVWLFSMWRYAKCPLCLNLSLTNWPKRHYHSSLWQQLIIAMGAQRHRCGRCRHNFISMRPRLPQSASQPTETEPTESDEVTAKAAKAVGGDEPLQPTPETVPSETPSTSENG